MHRSPRYRALLKTARTRQVLHYAAAAVAGGKIGIGVCARRVLTQFGFDQAYGFEDGCEIDPRQGAKAQENIRDRYALRGLLQMFARNHRGKRRLQAFLQPVLHRHERVLFALQLFGQAHHEVRLQGSPFQFHLAQNSLKHFGAKAHAGGQPVGPHVCRFAQLLRLADAGGQSGQAFQQRQPEQQWKSP